MPASLNEYRRRWRAFCAWCEAEGFHSLPADPAVVALYVTERASQVKAATITDDVAAIRHHHKRAGHPSPVAHPQVEDVLVGIRRTLGTAPAGKAALLTEDVRAMVMACEGDELLDVRDRALLLVGSAGAFRRSELVGLDVGDVQVTGEGLIVTLRRSKTDQEG